MRRLLAMSVAVVLAAGVAVSVSLFDVSEARSQTASDVYSQIVDNATEGRFEAPGWSNSSSSPDSYGDDYSVAEPAPDAQPARFKVDIPETGEYTVFARWPASDDHNVSTQFGVSTASGVQWTEVDQQSNGGKWMRLGTYTMEKGDDWSVQVSRVDYFRELVVADAIKVVEGAQEGLEGALGAGSTDSISTTGRGVPSRAAWRNGTKFLGVNYNFGNCHKRRGMDCSCLTKRAYAPWRDLPDSPRKQWTMRKGDKVKRSNIRPGDVLFFDEVARVRGIDHVGIAAPNNEILHASTFCGKVCHTKRQYIMDDFVGAKRFLHGK